MDNIKHIFFDLDHTLWDFDKNAEETLLEILVETGIENELTNVSEFINTYKAINAKYWNLYNHGKATKEQIRSGRFKDALNVFDIKNPVEKGTQLSHLYIKNCPQKKNIFPGTHEVLNYLKEKYTLHIITNGFKEVQFIKLDNCDLTAYFDLILCSEEVGVNKPNPLVFETAMQKVGAKAKESVMIGDNPETDIMGAKNCGLHTVLFNPENLSHNVNSTEIQELRTLMQLL